MVWTLYRALSETGYMLKMKTTTYGHLALVALWAHSGMQCRPQRIAYRDPYLLQITSCHALQITGVHQRRHSLRAATVAMIMRLEAIIFHPQPDSPSLEGATKGTAPAAVAALAHTVSQSMATSMSPSASVLPDDGTLMEGLSGSSAADAA